MTRQGPYQTIQDNAAYYIPLCEAACRENPSLIVLPEIALQWGLEGNPIDLAVPAPGPETEAFAEIAQQFGFCDQSAFTQAFRKHTGITPLKFRKRYAT